MVVRPTRQVTFQDDPKMIHDHSWQRADPREHPLGRERGSRQGAYWVLEMTQDAIGGG